MSERIRVAVADGCSNFREYLTEELQKFEEIEVVGTASSGEEALSMILKLKPSIAIIDVMMPVNDGVWILEELKSLSVFDTNCIMISTFDKDEIAKYTFELGAKYYIVKPFDVNVLVRRIKYVCEENSVENQEKRNKTTKVSRETPKNLDFITTSIMNRLGISASIKGYHYLRSSIEMVINNENAIMGITKQVYPDIAKVYKTSASKVERAIRHAIESAWKKDDGFTYCQFTGNHSDRKPTNGQFIATVAEHIKLCYPDIIKEK